ncbi:MAG: ferrous iron transport protein B [Ruminococcus sp.]|jgi:ferrous iron transport protein B
MEFFDDLTQLNPGQSAVIQNILLTDAARRRVQEMGIIPGARITCLYPAPSGDPIAFQVCGAVVALRREDARQIQISSISSRKIVALAGNPNVGKSTLFNQLTGMNQHVGNWPGKTVESVRGICACHGYEYEFVDLPGTYSLFSHSSEEEITCQFLSNGSPDAVIVVCDGGCLQRNLILALQILEITPRVILCLNMMDEVKRQNITIDFSFLEEKLSVPVLGITARKKQEVNRLLQKLEDFFQTHDEAPAPYVIPYPEPLSSSIHKVQNFFAENPLISSISRWTALRLLDSPDPESLLSESQLSLPQSCYGELKLLLHQEKETLKERLSPQWQDCLSRCAVQDAGQIAAAAVGSPERKRRMQTALDHLFTGKITSLFFMLLGLFLILWLTVSGANVPSSWLSQRFATLGEILFRTFSRWGMPAFLNQLLIRGVYRTTAWVISVMLPPMAVFFPLFTILEDFGYLPRVSFNLDCYFQKCRTCGKQALTMCMGLGCNAVGVTGCRIIDSPRDRLIAILTNSLMPCNGRFPTLILTASLLTGISGGFSGSLKTALILLLCICFSVFMTFLLSAVLSRILKKEKRSSFLLELPPYRKPQFWKVILRSLLDRTLFVLSRAVAVAAPAGFLIFILANIQLGGNSLLSSAASFFDPLGKLMGLDGVVLLSFILGFPANEIVLPIMVMIYTNQNHLMELADISSLRSLLLSQGWNTTTLICFLIFSLLHWPCSTTCLTIKKETGSIKWMLVSIFFPTACGILLCTVFHTTVCLIAG